MSIELATKATTSRSPRPDKQHYFLLIALAARTRADCLGRQVGAVITREGRVLSTGYNGTPFGVENCSEGGCERCAQRARGETQRGHGYDTCICVHAEQNALLTAARFGQQTLGATLTTTLQPCFGCLKEMAQAGIEEVYYLHPWADDDAFRSSEFAHPSEALRNCFHRIEQIGDPSLDTPDLFAGFLRSVE